MKSGELNLEIQTRHLILAERSGLIGKVNGSAPSSVMHLDGAGSDEDSNSVDEPQPISLKKSAPEIIPLRMIKEVSNDGLSGPLSRAVFSNLRENAEDNDDDDCSGPSGKDGGVSTSFTTSGENSDAEMGGENEELSGGHLKSEDSRKCFECDVCNMTFSNGANMRRHRMRHTGVKPYECRVCQKRFFRKDHLAEHMATHSKLLPFRCPICNKGFQRQIAMRAHFQNEHVGGSHDMVKACPLCSYKAGSMKSLRVHFRTRHGIDLDNPVPHSSSGPNITNGNSNGSSCSPGPGNNNNINAGDYSELAHALGFEDREKMTESVIPSHFLVPQIEISSNSPYPAHCSFSADSSYNFAQDEANGGRRSSSPPHVSPQSDSSSHLPSSGSDHGRSSSSVVIKKEVLDEQSGDKSLYKEDGKILHESSDTSDDVQDMPEDLSAGSSGSSSGSCQSPKYCSSSAISKLSPLKSLLREEWKSESKENGQTGFNSSGSSSSSTSNGSSRSLNEPYNGHSTTNGHTAQAYDSEAISSSNNGGESGTSQTAFTRRRLAVSSTPAHQCVFCGIIFPDKTLYFLHKGCHSDSNPWRCNICGESCTNVYDFNSHLLSKSHQ